MLLKHPFFDLDPIAAGGYAVIPGMQQPDNFGKALFVDAMQEQKRKKLAEEQAAKQKADEEIKSLLAAQKTAWAQDIPVISSKVNELVKTYAESMSKGVDPFNAAKNPEAYMAFREKAYEIENAIISSKQDKTFYDLAEKKAMEENYMNEQNTQNLEGFKAGKLGERQNFKLQYNYNEPKYIKEVAGVVKTNKIDVLEPDGPGKTKTTTTKAADPQGLLEAAKSVMLVSTGPQPEGFKQGVAADIQNMSDDQLVDNAMFFLQLNQGGEFDDAAAADVKKQLLADRQILVANAAMGRAAIKINAAISDEVSVNVKTDPKWLYNNMFGGGGGADPKKLTTFGIVTENIATNWNKHSSDPMAFFKEIGKQHGVMNEKGNGVILNIPTDGKAQLMPGGSVQVGVTRTADDSMPYGSITQFETVMAYYNPSTRAYVTLEADQIGKPEYKGLNAAPVIRAKFSPATISENLPGLDQYGRPIPNPEYQKLMNQGIDPRLINKGMYAGTPNYMYFNPSSDTDRNMLNNFVTGATTAYSGQKATEQGIAALGASMIADY